MLKVPKLLQRLQRLVWWALQLQRCFSAASPIASPLSDHEESDLQIDSSELATNPAELQTAFSGTGNVANSELLIDWVRYQGQCYKVARQDERGMLWLRQSGFTEIKHKVHVSKVKIGGYRQ